MKSYQGASIPSYYCDSNFQYLLIFIVELDTVSAEVNNNNLTATDSIRVTSSTVDEMAEEVVEGNEVKEGVTAKIELKDEGEVEQIHLNDKTSNEPTDSLAYDAGIPINVEQSSKDTLKSKASDMNKADSDTEGDYQRDEGEDASDSAESSGNKRDRRRRAASEVNLLIY